MLVLLMGEIYEYYFKNNKEGYDPTNTIILLIIKINIIILLHHLTHNNQFILWFSINACLDLQSQYVAC
jgi:hypothetical protein